MGFGQKGKGKFPPIAGGVSKTSVKEGGTKSFLPAADFHGHELQVLIKMCTTGRKSFKIP